MGSRPDAEGSSWILYVEDRRMKFVLVNHRTPHPQSFCALCCEPIAEAYLRHIAPGSPTVITGATSVTANLTL
jgi:hypothetical protein